MKISVETFGDESEGEFLIWKRNFNQTTEDWELTLGDDIYGTKHLYIVKRKFPSDNVLDNWLDNLTTRTIHNYAGFKEDLQALTEQQIGDNAFWEQKKYLENAKKPQAMKSKEWMNQIKVMNNYFPWIKCGQRKVTDQGLIEKIIKNTIQRLWRIRWTQINQ